ncbi:hypothetical protein ACFL67_03805 [candidate division KSB1 bacterium]
MLEYAIIVLGAISVFIGLLFIINPKALIKLNEIGNNVIFDERKLLMYPRIFGGVMFALSLYLIYLGLD